MTENLNILIVEDDEDDTLLMLRTLRRAGFEVHFLQVETADAMRTALTQQRWDLVLSDYSMPNFSGFEALQVLQDLHLDLPFIIVSGAIGEEYAVEIMRAGAHDYVMKGNLARLIPAIQRELREVEVRRARQRAEAQVELLSSALEQSASLVLITDTSGIITYVNPAFCRITGYDPNEVLGVHSRILRSQVMPAEIFVRLWTTILAGETWRGELLNRKKNGEEFWAEVRISAVRNPVGEVTQYLSVQEDITARKRMEAEIQHYTSQLELLVEERTAQLRRAKEEIEIILKHTSDAIALTQANGDVQTVNPAYREMFGEEAENSVERVLHSITEDANVTAVAEAMLKVLYDGEIRRVEAKIMSQDGKGRDIDVSLIPVRGDNNQAGMVISARDISQFKEVERFKSRFIANAVHDLSTPISALSTRLHMLKRSPDRLPEHVRALENQVEHLRNLLADLQLLSQLDRRQVTPQLEATNINELAQRVFDTYEPVAISKQQRLCLMIDPDIPNTLLDRRQCDRVLINLVSNAVNYTDEHKDICIRTFMENGAVCVEVSDRGMGIAPDDLARIFDRFYRSDEARMTRATGTGLGLAIVKEIMDLHDGAVDVESQVGSGSTFVVRFPLKSA